MQSVRILLPAHKLVLHATACIEREPVKTCTLLSTSQSFLNFIKMMSYTTNYFCGVSANVGHTNNGSSNKDFQTWTVDSSHVVEVTSVKLAVIYSVCFAKSP